jgi:cadmium resistance protein CadD (predicted permease)
VATAGLWADVGVAVAAFAGTNVDNCVVTAAMVAGAPLERAHRIAMGQVAGFCVIVAVAAAASIVLFEFSAAVVGLLGLVPLAMGVRGLVGLGRDGSGGTGAGAGAGSRAEVGPAPARRGGRIAQRAVGRSMTAAALVTIAAGGDNLAVYIPLFRVGGGANLGIVAVVFVLGEVAVSALVLWAGRHPRARATMGRLGAVAVPVLLCAIGIVVLVRAGSFGLL